MGKCWIKGGIKTEFVKYVYVDRKLLGGDENILDIYVRFLVESNTIGR